MLTVEHPLIPLKGGFSQTAGLAPVHVYVYIKTMKRAEPERRLRALGWTLQRHGGRHDVWTSADGTFTEYVPRHAEINEQLARAILRRAEERR